MLENRKILAKKSLWRKSKTLKYAVLLSKNYMSGNQKVSQIMLFSL